MRNQINSTKTPRAAWETPVLTRMKAGDAELGTRNINMDGPISKS